MLLRHVAAVPLFLCSRYRNTNAICCADRTDRGLIHDQGKGPNGPYLFLCAD
jgi:hypothetical protein